MPCSMIWCYVEDHQKFAGTYCFYNQGRRRSQTSCKWSASLLLVWRTLRTWRHSQYIPPKRRWTSTRLQGVTFQKMVVFIVTAVRTCRSRRVRVTFARCVAVERMQTLPSTGLYFMREHRSNVIEVRLLNNFQYDIILCVKHVVNN
jgi:hypothetical protein